MSPEVVVDAILDGLRHRQPRIYPGRRTSMLAHLVTGACYYVGGYAAAASSSCSGSAWVKPGCQRRKSSARSSLRTQVRTWSSRWAQLDGVELDRVFTDIVSGKSAARPQLQALLAYVRDGDTVIVHSMDRLARNLDDLRRLVRELTRRGVAI